MKLTHTILVLVALPFASACTEGAATDDSNLPATTSGPSSTVPSSSPTGNDPQSPTSADPNGTAGSSAMSPTTPTPIDANNGGQGAAPNGGSAPTNPPTGGAGATGSSSLGGNSLGGSGFGGSSFGGSAGTGMEPGGDSGGSGGAAGASTGGGGGPDGSAGTLSIALELSSPTLPHSPDCSLDNIESCPVFPLENTQLMGSANVSPELNWTQGPEGTQSYAISLHDLSNGFTHWVIWNIGQDVQMLAAAAETGTNPSEPAGATQVSFQQHNGYAGPGANDHVYEFVLYALGTPGFEPSNVNNQGTVYEELQSSSDVLVTSSFRAASPP